MVATQLCGKAIEEAKNAAAAAAAAAAAVVQEDNKEKEKKWVLFELNAYFMCVFTAFEMFAMKEIIKVKKKIILF